MIFRVPSYYKKFQCIAANCKNSCCIGWEVDIDEDTASYYKTVDGVFGKRLQTCLHEEAGETYFSLRENGWCPFLNKEKLCDICIELGEEALSEVCTEYPRFVTEYANVREKFLSISCEEVGRILFSSKEKCTWEEYELPGVLDAEKDTEDLAKKLEETRKKAIAILQDRKIPIFLRAAEYLQYCQQMQYELFGDIQQKTMETSINAAGAYDCLCKRMQTYETLEVLDETWIKERERIKQLLTEETYILSGMEFLEKNKECAYEYEHFLVYITFRYFMQSYYDHDILSKAQFAIASVLMLRDMDVARYLFNGKRYELADRIDVARIYSREVEHSEENLERLERAFGVEEVFRPQSMMEQLLQYDVK